MGRSLAENIHIIRNGVYGTEVRDAIADALDGSVYDIPQLLEEYISIASSTTPHGGVTAELVQGTTYRLIFSRSSGS